MTLGNVHVFAARRFIPNRAAVLAVLLLLVAAGDAQPPAPPADTQPSVTIKEVMEMTITPATNTLWGAPERPTEEDWAALERAAIALLAATEVIARGGADRREAMWVRDPAWVAFSKAMANAGLDALEATRARNLDALLEAGGMLYYPCEGCHLQFHPGVAAEK